MHDDSVISRIVSAIDPKLGDRCVEIGPGRGALTAPLVAHLQSLDVVELDRDLARVLGARFGPGLRVHSADALTFDFSRLAKGPGELRIVGNLPYNISTPLLFHLFKYAPWVRDLHLMLQLEVVNRLAADPGSSSYGRLSVMAQFHCRPTMLFAVSAHAFQPQPRVQSAVIRLVPHSAAPVPVRDRRQFARIVALAFSQRRKTLRNSLRGALSADEIASAGVDPSARAETVGLTGFAALANALEDPGG